MPERAEIRVLADPGGERPGEQRHEAVLEILRIGIGVGERPASSGRRSGRRSPRAQRLPAAWAAPAKPSPHPEACRASATIPASRPLMPMCLSTVSMRVRGECSTASLKRFLTDRPCRIGAACNRPGGRPDRADPAISSRPSAGAHDVRHLDFEGGSGRRRRSALQVWRSTQLLMMQERTMTVDSASSAKSIKAVVSSFSSLLPPSGAVRCALEIRPSIWSIATTVTVPATAASLSNAFTTRRGSICGVSGSRGHGGRCCRRATGPG